MTFATTGLTAWPQIASPVAAAPASAGIGFTGVIGEMLATLAQGASTFGTAAPVVPATATAPAPATLPLSAFIPVHPEAAAFGQPVLAPRETAAATAPPPPTAPNALIETPAASAPQREAIATDVRPAADSAILPNILAAQLVPKAGRTQPPVAPPAIRVVPTPAAPEIPASPAMPVQARPDRPPPRAGAPVDILARPAPAAPQEAADVAKSGPAPRDAVFVREDRALPAHVAPPTWPVLTDATSDMPLPPAAVPTPGQAVMQTPAEPVVQTPTQTAIPMPASAATPTQAVMETPTEPVVETPAQAIIRPPAQTAIPMPAPAAIPTPTQAVMETPAQPVVETPAQAIIRPSAQTATPMPAPAAIPMPAQGTARRLPVDVTERTARTRAPAVDGDDRQPVETQSGVLEMATPLPAMLPSVAMPDATKTRDPQGDVTADRGDAPKANASGVPVQHSTAPREVVAHDVGRSTATADTTLFVPTPPAPDVASDARPITPAFHLADPVQSVARPVQVPAALAQPPVPVIPAQPGRIGHDLGVEIARRVSAGGDELVVRLDPAELGRIEVRMSFDDRGGLKTVIAADSPVALDMLRRDSADLGRSLSDAGFQGAGQGLRFDSGSGERNQGQPRSPWLTANQKPGQTDDFTATPDFDQTAYRSLRTSGRYDLIA